MNFCYPNGRGAVARIVMVRDDWIFEDTGEGVQEQAHNLV